MNSKGFLIVASKNLNFYKYAINLANSIRDFYEDANIVSVPKNVFLMVKKILQMIFYYAIVIIVQNCGRYLVLLMI